MGLFQRTNASGYSTGRFSFEAFEEEQNGAAPVSELSDAADQGAAELPEATAEVAEINAEVQEAQEYFAALEDAEEIADYHDTIENPSEDTAALAAAQQEQAIRAVDADGGEDVVPSAESFVSNRRISTEGFREWIAEAWARLKEFVANIWFKIKKVFKKYVNGTGSLQKRAKALKERLKEKKNEKDGDAKIKLSLTVLANTESGKFSPEFAYDNLTAVENEAKKLLENFKKPISTVSAATTTLLGFVKGDLTESDAKKAQDDLRKALRKAGDELASKDFRLDNRYGKSAYARYEPFPLGNKALFSVVTATGNETISATINGFKAEFGTIHKSFNVSSKDNEHAPLEFNQIENVASKIEDVAKALEKFFESGADDLEKEADKIKKAVDEKVKDAKEAESAYGKQIIQAAQRTYVVPTQFIRASLTKASFLVQVAGAYLTLADTSLNKYKDKDKKD